MEIKEIKDTLKKCGIKKGDTLMIYGDAGIAAQINSKKKDKLKIFFDQLIHYIGNRGTILVPTFTYTFCKKKIYHIKKTPSDLGMFSENFRKRKNIKRTLHPIFSFSIYGKKYKYFSKASISTCFGKDSIFDFFKKNNGKILCVGCSFNRVTFVHYIEEFFGVKYRYKKYFTGKIISNNHSRFIETEYYVRKLNCRSKVNLNYLYGYLTKNKKINNINFGRYNFSIIKAKTLFSNCLKILKKNEYILVKKNN